jgi:membrane-bound lytic murein transglycosylase B
MASRRKERRHRTARWQKATALIPLALLAGAWTASLGSPTTATANSVVKDPGVPAVPATSLDQPASYTVPPTVAPRTITPNGNQPALDPRDPSSLSSNGIPTAAMAAYQRAEAVLAKADPSCHVSWALIAAIGRVESDHGRYGGSVLGANGKSTPGIFGLPLDGTQATALIRDTDSGAYDNDPVYDRAVGPMQFIPGTWDIVGVDGDADGVRDPQDIDDAALATGVYLCAGDQDLSTEAGQRSAVFGYNHSEQYVDLVLSVMRAYLSGDYNTVADGLPSPIYIPAKESPTHPSGKPHHNRPGHQHNQPPNRDNGGNGTPGNPGGNNPPPNNQPAPGNEPNPGGNNPPPNPTPTNPPTTTPVPKPPPPPPPVEHVLTMAEATAQCASKLNQFPLATPEMVTACAAKLKSQTQDEANALLSGNTLAEVLTNLGLSNLIPAGGGGCLPLDC